MALIMVCNAFIRLLYFFCVCICLLHYIIVWVKVTIHFYIPEYTDMAINLKEAFDKAVSRYLESETSSDEDAVSSRPLAGSPTSLSHPSRHLPSSHHNARKRSKKSTKKSKSYKPESKTKSKSNEKMDEDEKRNKSIKVAKKKRGKKKGKKVKEEELDEDEEEQEDQESEDAISETSILTSKRRKNVDVNSLLKTKKLPKESEELKTSNKKASKERHQSKKDSEIVRSAKEAKENKKRKEDFEEDYEPPIITKSKSRKIEKKELEETTILTDNTKKSKLKKIEVEESDTVFKEDKKQSSHVKTKKNRKKEKSNLKTVTRSDEKSDKGHMKQKNKKSKQKNEELKNGELKSQTDSKEVELENALDSKHTHISKKLSTLIGNKDVDSLDSLKDKISDRRREEKLKNEKEKQRKAMKSDTHGVYSKKVPSNSNTFHDNDKDSAKRSKSKKSMKEDKTDDAIKKHNSEINENKKSTHAKHTKGLGAEENAAIQALNQATEKTLHVSLQNIAFKVIFIQRFLMEHIYKIYTIYKSIISITFFRTYNNSHFKRNKQVIHPMKANYLKRKIFNYVLIIFNVDNFVHIIRYIERSDYQ